MTTVPIDEIATAGRHRTDLGNIAELADSILEVGLLHPVVITPDLHLVAGERRLAAVRHLGWTDVPVTVVTTLSDAYDLLRAESDENTCRKAFTPSEAESIASAREAMLRPLAQEAQARPGQERSAKFAGQASGETRKAAATGTGYSHETIRKVREVKETIESEATPEPVREAAKQALAEMDSTGRVDGSYRRLKAAEQAASDPVEDYLAGQTQVAAQMLRANVRKALVAANHLPDHDAANVAAAVDDEFMDDLTAVLSRITTWAEAVRSARPRGLRVVGSQ